MVKIHPVGKAAVDGQIPIMPMHTLNCLKNCRSFNKGDTLKCFISKFTGEARYAIMEASYNAGGDCKFYEVFTEKELHETFDEL